MKDYYEILEVRNDASNEVIKMAYKALALKYHPDVSRSDKATAENKMKVINEAFDVLSDPVKRAEYDRLYTSSNEKNKRSGEEEKEREEAHDDYDTEEPFEMDGSSTRKVKTKKKIYKRKRFWIGLVLIVLLFAIASSPESETSNPQSDTSTLAAQQPDEQKPDEKQPEEEQPAEEQVDDEKEDFEQYVDMVKGGYLGDYHDVTLGEVLDSNHSSGKWSSGVTDDGKKLVAFKYKESMDEIKLSIAFQFIIIDNKTFQLVAMDISGQLDGTDLSAKATSSVSEIAGYMTSEYLNYYSYTYPNDDPIDHMPSEATENIINGTAE